MALLLMMRVSSGKLIIISVKVLMDCYFVLLDLYVSYVSDFGGLFSEYLEMSQEDSSVSCLLS